MPQDKGRLVQLERALQERIEAAKRPPREGMRPLRSNELHRLLSILNKIKRKRTLRLEDEHDLKEISEIQEGRLDPSHPEQTFFHAALARNVQGRICWIHQLYEHPIRDLTPEEQTLWFRVGPGSMFGYMRADGSIQAYVLSGLDEPSPSHPEGEEP